MCRSPDELDTAELERLIALVTSWRDNPHLSPRARQIYEGRKGMRKSSRNEQTKE